MRKLLLLSACLWVLAGPAQAQAGPPAVAVVRVYDGKGHITAVVTREGRTEQAQFDSGPNEKGLAQASEGYQKLLSLLYQEGYVIQTSMSQTDQFGHAYVTLILAKKAS